MLINTKLPLSLDYLQKQDQTFSLSGIPDFSQINLKAQSRDEK